MTVLPSASDGADRGFDLAPAPAPAVTLFGDRLELAERYAGLLAGDGVAHGHIGPREVPRLWERHLLNCAVVADLIPHDQRVLDVGSGAGLPGLALAIRRPDLRVVLLEPMLRRVSFLERCIAELGLTQQVSVVRGRAGDRSVSEMLECFTWATARAVAPLERLVGWCVPLLAEDGTLLALKGISAAEELSRAAAEVSAAGFSAGSVSELRVGEEVSRVVVLGPLASSGRKSRKGSR